MTDFRAIARAAAERHGIDPEIFVRQINAESGFNPRAGSPAGAQGIAQIMPATAKGWGVDPMDPVAALDASARAMSKYVRNYGGWKNALVAYNAGPGRVGKPMYAETAAYVSRILGDTNPRAGARVPARGVTAAPQSNPVTDTRTKALEFIFKDSPYEGMATARYTPTRPSATAPAASPNVTTGKGVPARKKGETGQQYLDRVLQAKFGLKHDAGNSQTTGGRHVEGSDHYRGTATDFGNGLNDPATLQAAEDYLNANAQALGIKQVLYGADVAGHADHLHAATIRKALNKGRSFNG